MNSHIYQLKSSAEELQVLALRVLTPRISYDWEERNFIAKTLLDCANFQMIILQEMEHASGGN